MQSTTLNSGLPQRSLDCPGVGIQAGTLGKILFSLVALRFCVPQFSIYVTKTLDKTNAIQSIYAGRVEKWASENSTEFSILRTNNNNKNSFPDTCWK